MELQQQQQQVVQLEGLENATARNLLGKLINILLAVMAVLLVFVSTVANCVVPLMKTRNRTFSTLFLVLFGAFLWKHWDALFSYVARLFSPARCCCSGLPLGACSTHADRPTTRALSESVYIRITFFSSRDTIAIVFFRFYTRSFLGENLGSFLCSMNFWIQGGLFPICGRTRGSPWLSHPLASHGNTGRLIPSGPGPLNFARIRKRERLARRTAARPSQYLK
jgi:hypothetical protein